jgi:choline-sulfatase
MPDAGYLLKSGPWKYSYYGPAHPPQLFNLETDPDELHDLSSDRERVSGLDAELRSILDPVRTDVQAKNDQAARAAR